MGIHVKLLMEINLSNSSVYLNISQSEKKARKSKKEAHNAKCSLFIYPFMIRYPSMQFQFLLIKTVSIRFLFDDIQQMCTENTRTHT